jgi:hypothetical protein
MSWFFRWVVILAAVVFWSQPSLCQPAGPKPAVPEATSACTTGRASAISELACEVKQGLGKLPASSLVVASPLVSDQKAATPNELGARLASVVAGALGSGIKNTGEPATLARARTLAAKAGTLVHLQPEIVRGELRLTADVYPVPKNFWDRVRDPEPSPTSHTYAARRVDAELRTFFPPVPLVAKHIDKATTSEGSPVAVACGDVNGDGALEIVLVGRTRVQIGRLRGGRFVAFAQSSWTQLSPLSRSPLREPIASAVIEPGKWLDIGSSDRLDAVRLDASFVPIQKLGRRLPWPGGGCAKILGTNVRPEIEACAATDGAPPLAKMERVSDALAGAIVTTKSGKSRVLRAQRAFNESLVVLRDDAGKRVEVEGVGAQIAVADVDGDGQPELIGSADTLEPAGDALVVRTWQDDGKLVERTRVAVQSGVRAVAACPTDSSGLSPVVMATQGEIWLIH